MNKNQYDLIVIGGGAGGSTCTAAANATGYRVAQVERDRIGGTCLNYGCDPTKTLLHIGQVAETAMRAEKYEIWVKQAQPNWQAALTHVRQVQQEMRGGEPEEAIANLRDEGIDLIKGEATFVSSHEIEVNGQRLYGKNILIATGTEPLIPEIPGLREGGFITNREAVSLRELPTRLAVIGSGSVGTEFAQLFRRFGVDVVLFEESDQILPKDDQELANALADTLEKEGIEIYTKARLIAVEATTDGKYLTVCRNLEHEEREEQLVFDEVLLALGRRPTVEVLNLGAIGVETKDGRIVVDEMLRTSVPHIWAAGDIVTDFPFTHTAVAQSQLLAHNIFSEEPIPFNKEAIPWVTYTSPELAHVGQTEQQLQQMGVAYHVARVAFADVARAQITGQKKGLVKLLVAANDTILGGHILAVNAGELIAPVVLAMRNHLPLSALQDVILPYPTMMEAIRQAARQLL